MMRNLDVFDAVCILHSYFHVKREPQKQIAHRGTEYNTRAILCRYSRNVSYLKAVNAVTGD